MAVDLAPPPPRPVLRRRLALAPCASADVARLEAELGVSHVLAQVLARRGLGDVEDARAWLAADERHPAEAFAGMPEAVALVRRHVERGSRITVHGDYDVDGVCATAILVRALRSLGATVDWYLPSRLDDGYGLSLRTVERLAARGTGLLITADCGITAVEEVAAARAAGMDVLVTDHHAPRRGADGASPGPLPDAPVVHPGVCGYPCPELCAAGVALKLAEALGAPTAAGDLDLAALATVADVVPLRGENRRIVREGLRALAATPKPGLRALMRVGRVAPTRLDARAVGFRLAPRINAAGRLYRADAGLELVLTEDLDRAAEIADELDRANAERRHTEQRILFEAEAQVAAIAREREEAGLEPALAYVLAGEGWHPGVVGIVAGRIAERHHRPAVLIALDGPRGTGSARSIPGFDLLAALDASAEQLARHGGHRAAAGLEIETDRLDAFRAAFLEHAEEALEPDDLVPEVRVDAVVAGGDVGLELAEELGRLEPFGHGNPAVSLLIPAARITDPRPMGEGRHVRFTVEAGGIRCRGVSFGNGPRLPIEPEEPADLTFALELDDWAGGSEPRLILRHAQACEPAAIEVVGEEEPPDWLGAALDEATAGTWPPARDTAGAPSRPAAHDTAGPPAPPPPDPSARRTLRDRRDRGVAGTVAALVATGEPVLVVCADARCRLPALASRLGGFALTSWAALVAEPGLADAYEHVVLIDPPADPGGVELAGRGHPSRTVHLAWGEPEVAFTRAIHDRDNDLRPELIGLYRVLRDAGRVDGERLEAALRGDGSAPRGARRAGLLLRILAELGLVAVDPAARAVDTRACEERTELERSPTFRALAERRRRSDAWLTRATSRAA